MKRRSGELDALVVGALAAIGPATAYALAAWLRGRGDGMPEIQVYRVMRRLMARGEARQVWLGRRYVSSSPGNPPAVALACRACGTLAFMPAAGVDAALRVRAAVQGFRVDEVIIEAAGRCARCRGAAVYDESGRWPDGNGVSSAPQPSARGPGTD